MEWRPQINERGVLTGYRNTVTNEVVSPQDFERHMSMQGSLSVGSQMPGSAYGQGQQSYGTPIVPPGGQMYQQPQTQYAAPPMGGAMPVAPAPGAFGPQAPNILVKDGAEPLAPPTFAGSPGVAAIPLGGGNGTLAPTRGQEIQAKTLRLEGNPRTHIAPTATGKKGKGFLDATSVAILLPTLILLALVIAAAHKKRLFPWQTIRTFNPPSGMMTPRDYERSFVCPPNGRRHGRIGKKNPNATWTEADGVVLPFGFLARTHLPVTIPMGRLPNKNMFIVAPSGSGKTTLMRAVIKALLAKPCVIIALEAKANDPNLDERREGFKYTVLPEAQQAGFRTLYFNPLDSESICWNPLDLDATTFASSIVQDINSLPPEEQHWAERDFGYIEGLVQLLKWGAVQVNGEDENGQAADFEPLTCNPYGLMKLVNNRRNIVESMRRLKSDPNINAGELSELTQRLSSIIRTDSDWDKNIQGVRGRLRMFKNKGILRVTEASNVDLKGCMREPTVLIFGAPASLGPDAESLAACFVYQLQQALHTRYGTKNVLPLFAFFDEYQTLNIDLAGRLSAIVRGANGGLTVILQNVSQITSGGSEKGVSSELKTIFSNSAIRVCLHNADETTAKFFSEEIGKHAVVVPGVADHFQANGFGIFPTSWNRIHSQQVVARVDSDSIKRMEKHHALVYLSPAGDPEFGETKPFMVDLRGIEDIARLHLLHNVTARKQRMAESEFGNGLGEDGMETGTFESPAPMRTPGAPAFARNIGHAFEAMDEMQVRGAVVDNGHMPQDDFDLDQAYAAPAQPPSPYEISQTGAYAQMQEPVQTQHAQTSTGANNGGSPRLCQHCAKPAGKGKFCIECGEFIGLPQAQAQVQAQVSAAVAPAHVDMTANAPANLDSFGNPVYGEKSEGNLSALPSSNGNAGSGNSPRYGGLRPTSRDAMPSKKGLFDNAQAGGEADVNSGHNDGNFNQNRRPVTSLNPDNGRMGIDKKRPGLEF